MTSDVLDAAARLALAIRDMPKVERFLQAFDFQGHRDFASRVNEITVGFSFLQDSPLLLGVRMNHLRPAVESLWESEDDKAWLVTAIDVGHGFQVVIEFVRSRLPGYPMLRVPHRRVGSPYLLGTDPFIVHHFPWDRSLAGLALQQKPPPDLTNFGGALDGADLQRELAAALPDLDAWQAFEAASQALTEEDRAALSELGSRVGRAMVQELVKSQAGDRLVAQYAYRMAVLREGVDSTAGRVLGYLRAFEDVDQAITILTDFIQTLIVSGEIRAFKPDRLDLGAGGDFIDADVLIRGDDPFLNLGRVIALDGHPSGFVHPDLIQHRWKGLSDSSTSTMRIHGKFIPD
jgi:hypothetical protein